MAEDIVGGDARLACGSGGRSVGPLCVFVCVCVGGGGMN